MHVPHQVDAGGVQLLTEAPCGADDTPDTGSTGCAQPFKRENKRTKARDAARAADAAQAEAASDTVASAAGRADASDGGASAAGSQPHQPQAGAVVEYPLSECTCGGCHSSLVAPVCFWLLCGLAEVTLPDRNCRCAAAGEVVRDQLRDGRSHGLALLVGRNMDRGDAGGPPLPCPVLPQLMGAAPP